MAAADLIRAAWFEGTAFVVGELHDMSGSAASAVVFPGPALALPSSTMRNLRSIAVLRLRAGPLWLLTVVGHRWTPDRLAFVACALVWVQGIGQIGHVHPELAGKILQFVGSVGRREVDPAARLQLGQFDEPTFFSNIKTNHFPYFMPQMRRFVRLQNYIFKFWHPHFFGKNGL